MAQGLAWMQGSTAVPTLAKSSISAARSKIGCAPLQALHQRACVPLANPVDHPHAAYPQAQCAVLVECTTHAIIGANFGPVPCGRVGCL